MKTNNSYLKHAFNVVKNPAGYTPEAVEKSCAYIQKKWDEMDAHNASLCDQLAEMMEKLHALESEKNDMMKTIASLQKQLSKCECTSKIETTCTGIKAEVKSKTKKAQKKEK